MAITSWSSLCRKVLFLGCVLSVSSATPVRAGLTINLVDGGGAAPSITGSGTLGSVMNAAANVWELAFNGSTFTHSLTVQYRWESRPSGILASHSLQAQGGSPNRETAGLIRFDNDGTSSFFADGSLNGSDPLNSGNSEYTNFNTTMADFGGGVMNTGRVFSGATGAAVGRHDLYSVALHEVGHALGISSAFLGYQQESWPDNDIDITSGTFNGAVLPTNNQAIPATPPTSNAHLLIGNGISGALMFPGIASGIRKLPSAADIAANAQLSQFSNPNYNLTAVPETSSVILLGIAFSAIGWRRRNNL